MSKLQGRVAVVTGAASGIGRALAHRLADAGAKLAISDIDMKGLEETRLECEKRGAVVDARRLDVADRKAVFAYADAVHDRFGAVHLVINNAGVALGAPVEDMSIEDFEWLMGINFWGVVYGTKAFLPYLKQADWGHIVNISSIFGIIAVPTQSAYNAAKFAVRGFTEALRQELAIDGSHVSCTTVHPGGIKTNIAANARVSGIGKFGRTRDQFATEFEKIARTTPDEAARVILEAVEKNRRRSLVGRDAKMIDLAQRAFPTIYQRFLEAGGKRQRTRS